MEIEYVGIDYHTKYAIATRMYQDGQLIGKDRINNTRDDIRQYLSQLPPGSKVAIESTNNWYAFVEWSSDLPIEVKLVHPGKTKAIAAARIKTDTIDSKVLTDLLRTNFIAESYLAPPKVRDVRELVRYRTTLARLRTHFITRIHSVLWKTGHTVTVSDVTGVHGRKELAQLPLRDIYRQEVTSCLGICDQLKDQIEQFEKAIQIQVAEDTQAQLLTTIPGIAFYSALLITSEIGDYRRFASSRKLCSFAGLVPSVYSSGGKTRRGSITKQGSANLRFVLLQAVPHVTRKNHRLRQLYLRVQRKHGNKTARIAVARKLLAIILIMLRTKQPFRADC